MTELLTVINFIHNGIYLDFYIVRQKLRINLQKLIDTESLPLASTSAHSYTDISVKRVNGKAYHINIVCISVQPCLRYQ